MSQQLKHLEKFGSINVSKNATFNKVHFSKTSVSQGTSITSGVTIDSPAGFVYTFTTGTLATKASTSFVVSNSAVQADSLVLGGIVNHGGNGIPFARVNSVTEGSFAVSVKNLDDTNAMTGSVKFGFSVL